MWQRFSQKICFKLTAWIGVGIFSAGWFVDFGNKKIAIAQDSNSCANIVNPLTPEEEKYARAAWQYFLNNYQQSTGFTNSFNGYPSGTLWDMGNYLMALNAARWLGLIEQAEFDVRLNKFLASIGSLRLFEDSLPNKVYNTATGEMVDYGNNPIERGIGWSALDIGRILAAFHVLRTCHPQYNDWLQSIIDRWAVERSTIDGYMFGATVLEDGQTLPVQEGRLGYEEYAARGYELWGFDVPKALSYEPFKLVEIYGVKLPVDTRRFQETNANNYVVSESYILDGIEFGFLGKQQEYAERVFEVQRRRYLATGQLTAVTEDNLDGAPHFLYNTIYSNGKAWATINEANEQYPDKRSISTKAAFGWQYIFPDSKYAQQLFQVAKDLISPDGGGFFAGIYEETNQPNEALTGNTNGLIMEILYYKARGNQPLIGGDLVSESTGKPEREEVVEGYPIPDGLVSDRKPVETNLSTSSPELPIENSNNVGAIGKSPRENQQNDKPIENDFVAIAPIDSVGKIEPSFCAKSAQDLTIPEQRYAKVAWQYFEANYQPETGLVSDRSDMKATSLWGIGDYLSALQSATALELVSLNKFDLRVRKLLATLQRLDLFAGELPHRGYDIRTLSPVDYGNNPLPEGNGWSGLDVGRILLSLHNLKSCYPQYTEAVDELLLNWSYLRVVRNGRLNNATVEADDFDRSLARVYPVNQLGYEEYAARGFQLWGFEAEPSAVGGEYQTQSVDGLEILAQRERKGKQAEQNYVIADPFIRYGLELGFDPQMRSLVYPMLQAEAQRYRDTGLFSAANTVQVQKAPYIIHSTIVGDNQPWLTVANNKIEDKYRVTSVATAFAYHALFPEDEYAQELQQAIVDLYNPRLGYYEGFYEATGKPALGFTSSTNAMVLQSLYYQTRNNSPILTNKIDYNSSWWQAIAQGDSGNGLPEDTASQLSLVKDDTGIYWTSLDAQNTISLNSNIPQSLTIEKTENNPPTEITRRDTATEKIATNDKTCTVNLKASDRHAAQQAWQYFTANSNRSTGLVNGVENYPWITLWDMGSTVLGIHSARQLNIIDETEFNNKITKLLATLSALPIPATGLPNKAYSTTTGEMMKLDNTPDPNGTSGWSALDTSRLLVALHTLRTHYPEHQSQVEQIVSNWDLTKLEKDGWLQGGIPAKNGKINYYQEGRLGYEQYAAKGLELWGIKADNALNNPPTQEIEVAGNTLKVDRRNYTNSNAGNYLTNDPYFLWGLELGWTETDKQQATKLIQAQSQRYKRTGILTAVNEDSLDRSPYFLYYSVYANGDRWNAITPQNKSYSHLKFLSTKAAFAASALFPNKSYTQSLKQAVEKIAVKNRGYPGGIYEDKNLGINKVFNVNTNAVILESILYQSRDRCPLSLNIKTK